jgi:hypothetical protein
VYWTLECNKLPSWNRTCELITIYILQKQQKWYSWELRLLAKKKFCAFINYFPHIDLLYLLLLLSDHHHLRACPLYSSLPSPKTKFRHLSLSLVASSVSPWLVMLSHFVIRSHLNNYTINSQASTRTICYAILYENISRSWTSGNRQSFVSVYCLCSVCVNTSRYE